METVFFVDKVSDITVTLLLGVSLSSSLLLLITSTISSLIHAATSSSKRESQQVLPKGTINDDPSS